VRRLSRAHIGDGRHSSGRPQTPRTGWFTACWLLAKAKDGISAPSLQRALEIGLY
jgi:hypothetical protein